MSEHQEDYDLNDNNTFTGVMGYDEIFTLHGER